MTNNNIMGNQVCPRCGLLTFDGYSCSNCGYIDLE